MKNVRSSAAIVAEIEALRADLRKVNAAVDIIGKPAVSKVEQITDALKVAQDKLADALADEVVEARNKRLSSFTDIRVDYARGNSVLSTAFTIHYNRSSYDYRIGMSVPQSHKCNGFAALDDHAFEYLLNVKPEAIPAEILALAPGDPHAAFDVYLAGKRRGYLKALVV
ncbi:hypothetical protein [Sphingomonas sp. AX6]|uniref:hypothetical protein n=1 Tax=Sphingomonas sp. AX6 TaxID=2653171 RepID=UPI0012F1745B|nr:hypothetical protein [Sphingomonas sp. AX6]VXC99378.1 conserved hypothetical protein [Sphingomonas sp. AX6]